MTNTSKQRGTRWETAIVDYLKTKGWPFAERRALQGSADRGDIILGIPGVVIEAKNAKEYRLAEWVNEAVTQGANDQARVAVVWAHRRGKGSAGDGYVIMTGDQFAYLLKEAGW